MLQHVGDPDAGQRLQRGLLGLAGDVGIPDLKRSGDVAAVATQQADDVLLDEASLLCEAGEHPPFGEQFPEEVLPPLLARPHGYRGERDRHRQDGAVDAELGDRGRIRQEVEGAPRPGEHPDPRPVQFDDQVSHAFRLRRDRGGQLHAGLAHGREQAIHQIDGLPASSSQTYFCVVPSRLASSRWLSPASSLACCRMRPSDSALVTFPVYAIMPPTPISESQ